MSGPTLPFALTKNYSPIFVDLREKQRKEEKKFSLSLLSLSLPPVCSSRSLFYFFYFSFFPFFFPLFPPLDTWLNVSHSHKFTTCHAMCHSTPDASKNVKFQLSRNPIKFDRLTRFHETNLTVKCISSSEI